MNAASPTEAKILTLYRASFPLFERRDDPSILTSIRSADYLTLTAFAGESLTCFALVFTPPNETFALLEYLAVDPSHQGGGVGSRLFQDVIAATADRHLLVEVEAHFLGVDAARRQRFYQRLGCNRITEINYLLPLPNSPPMELMIRSIDNSSIQLERWLRRIYELVYGCCYDDPRIDHMLR